MKEILRFNKPKTRPIQIEPWFFRYLNGGELKVVAAIIAHADIKNRQDNSFPSNRRIVVLAGFDIIKSDSKKYDEYEKATYEEKILIKKNRIKTGIQQVKNIKKKLEEKGLLKREIVGKPGKQKVYLILDYKWKREEYEREFREFETGEILEKNNDDNEMINNELEEIKRLIEEGSVSKDSLAQRLNNLSHKIKSKDSQFTDEIPIEDVEKVADYYMNTTKIKNRVEKGDIVNEAAFRQSIIKGIKEGTFTKVDEY